MNFQPLKDFLDFYLPMLGVPGSDTSVYRGHEEIFRYQSGYDNLRFRTPMRDNALYNVYSITKVSCAIAATQLIERGEILINDPVYAYFPEYKSKNMKGGKNMFKVIMTDKNGTEWCVGSDGTLMVYYPESRKLIYEFEDYEDANNVMLDFMENAQDRYGYEIEVVQM